MNINYAFQEMVRCNNQIIPIQIQADMKGILAAADTVLNKQTDELINIRRLTLKAWAWGGFDE